MDIKKVIKEKMAINNYEKIIKLFDSTKSDDDEKHDIGYAYKEIKKINDIVFMKSYSDTATKDHFFSESITIVKDNTIIYQKLCEQGKDKHNKSVYNSKIHKDVLKEVQEAIDKKLRVKDKNAVLNRKEYNKKRQAARFNR